MLLTIATTAAEPTDLGYLLRKHPDRLHERSLPFGTARVFFPEAGPGRCTAALAVEVDPVGLARGGNFAGQDGYVTDRPYVAGSLLSVALVRCFGQTLAGRSAERPDRVDEPWPLEARLSAVACPGGEAALRRAFGPLGYEVEARTPDEPGGDPWGGPGVAAVALRGTLPVRDLLRHLYVLIPAIDGSKHYYVGADEVEKLLRHGEGWLAEHPEKDWVVRRYLPFRSALARQALSRLVADEAEVDERAGAEEESLERPERLNDQRLAAVLAALRDPSAGIRSVVDLGCGEGRLLAELAGDGRFDRVLGLDASAAALDRAAKRLDRLHLPAARREAVRLVQGSVVYRDDRAAGFDAATLVEVIEHVDPSRLPALERVVFASARPRRVVVTTPNAEYNATWANLPAGGFRHRDHRFEWTRADFAAWAGRVGPAFGYRARLQGIGPEDPALGCPTQMALFDREADR